jgi:mannose-6-phosphate isomerase
MNPVPMLPSRFAHFYRGGANITALRGVPGPSERSPEEWLASTTVRFGAEPQGLSVLPDGRLLRDAVTERPDAWLGPEHVKAFGVNTGLLVKLLDAGERLPVHVHPSRSWARDHLGCAFGKTEAWYVVAAAEDATVHLGFRQDVAADELAGRVASQDVQAMLGAMHVRPVSAGDGIVVPAGLPHAIGEGIFVVEAQEPTDFSVLLEWTGFDVDGPADGHLGLGFPTALGAVDTRGHGDDEIDALFQSGRTTRADFLAPALPESADAYFRVHVARPERRVGIPAGFAVVVLLGGAGRLTATDADAIDVARGDVLAVPYAAGDWSLEGDLEAVVCRPGASAPSQGTA